MKTNRDLFKLTDRSVLLLYCDSPSVPCDAWGTIGCIFLTIICVKGNILAARSPVPISYRSYIYKVVNWTDKINLWLPDACRWCSFFQTMPRALCGQPPISKTNVPVSPVMKSVFGRLICVNFIIHILFEFVSFKIADQSLHSLRPVKNMQKDTWVVSYREFYRPGAPALLAAHFSSWRQTSASLRCFRVCVRLSLRIPVISRISIEVKMEKRDWEREKGVGGVKVRIRVGERERVRERERIRVKVREREEGGKGRSQNENQNFIT